MELLSALQDPQSDAERIILITVSEYCDGGDLAGVIRKCKNETKRIPEDMIWHLLTQLAQALHECHHGSGKHGNRPAILHRDLKPDNVFLDSANNVKLGDFGLSKAIENPHTEFANTYVGTPFYMSPELVIECRYNTKSDIWALGCLIYELCALEPPFQAKTQAQLAAKIRQGRFSRLPPMYSDELNHLIHVMLQTDHSKRPGTKDLLMHERVQFATRLKELSAREKDIKEM
ncbi:kinase-like domain-containing protein [Cladochytrium replicatum]|nr:kinase-like domain-containing protein [Cladochytrium replicatum]